MQPPRTDDPTPGRAHRAPRAAAPRSTAPRPLARAGRSGAQRAAAQRRAALVAGSVAALAAPAAACPTCGLTGDLGTLVYVVAFMAIPYVVVAATWAWIRRILKEDG